MFNWFKRGIPKRIPIKREEDYHTHYIGTTRDGRQFFGYETFVHLPRPDDADWTHFRKEYAVLYIFDKRGNHLTTKHWYAGTTAETSNTATTEKVEEFIQELGPVTYTDIKVKPFQVVIDGHVFGLVPSEKTGFVDLMPSFTIAFYSPWDGEYYT